MDQKLSTVLKGPVNFLASFRTIIEKFGEDAWSAAEYAWDSAKKSGLVKTAGKEPTWYLPGHKFEEYDYPDDPTAFTTREPIPIPTVGFEDAVDTITATLMPKDEDLRPFFFHHFSNFHKHEESGRRTMFLSFMDNIKNLVDNPNMPKGIIDDLEKMMRRKLSSTALNFLHSNFVRRTRSLRSPADIYRVFKELIFKSSFMDAYEKAKQRLKPEMTKRAFEQNIMVSGIPMKTWDAIEQEYEEQGRHHCLYLNCVICGNHQTCRCSTPKDRRDGVCRDCARRMGHEASSMALTAIHKYASSLQNEEI